MKNITREGAVYSVMQGIGDVYLPAALVALGASNFYLGLLSALPQFIGGALQFLSLNVLRAVRDRRLVSIAVSLFQALTWLPIIALIFYPGELSVMAIITLFSIGVGVTMMANPIWSSWVSDIVPENDRSRFFANRNRLMYLVIFLVTFGAGMLIRILNMQYSIGIAFAAVFGIAFISRLTCVLLHTKTTNVKYEIKLMNEIGLKHLFLLPAYQKELSFLAFVALMSFATQFCAPFFTPYMLNELGFDVGLLGILAATSIITKVISFPYWGKAIDRFGNRTVLVATGFAITVIPLMWLFSKDPLMIGVFQVASGFAWSGYELSIFNSALSIVGRELRPSFISKYNAFNAIATGLGAIAGGAFLMYFPNLAILGFSGILTTFLLSGVMRIITIFAFSGRLSRGREIENTSQDRDMIFRIVAVYPTQGAVQHVMNGWNFTRKVVKTGTVSSGIMFKEGIEATGEIVKEGGRKIMHRISGRKRL
jgi:MFS family permease